MTELEARPRVERVRGLRTPMADGVELVADLWRLAGSGPAPVLLQRLPYGRTVASSPVLPSPTQLARRGFAVLVQDVRGTGESGGVFVPFHHEAADGAATIEWAAGQSFCNGAVATYGFSYQGLDQVAAAALQPRGLRAIAPMMCGGSPYELVYEDGCLMLEHATRWAAQLGAIADRGEPCRVDPLALPVRTALGEDPPGFFLDWVANERPSDGHWADLAPEVSRVEVPSLVVLGYADTFAKASARLARALGAEVVAGPWAHMPWGSRLGALELGSEAGPAVAHDAFLAFLDRTLRGQPEDRPGARVFVVGEGWRDEEGWPPRARPVTFFAASDGGANSRHGDGRLEEAPPQVELGDELTAEPLAPHPAGSAPFADVSHAEDRRDVLCYTSQPLPDELVLLGSPEVTVVVSADCPGFDLFAALVLVEGNAARSLAVGARRIEQAEHGSPAEVTVELGPIGWRVPRGCRLRLDVSATSFPLYGRNPQSGLPGAGRGDHLVATIALSAATLGLSVGEPAGAASPG